MKIKFGDLSVSQFFHICKEMQRHRHKCRVCPLNYVCDEEPYAFQIDEYVEVELQGQNSDEC